LVSIGVLEEDQDYSSEWASPSLAILKKNETIRVVTDFRKIKTLNIECHPFPILKIGVSDMISSMERYTFDKEKDLNMGYYHIKLDADAQKPCSIVFPWHTGKYKYKCLPWVSIFPGS
jgi:hypothetical protein